MIMGDKRMELGCRFVGISGQSVTGQTCAIFVTD